MKNRREFLVIPDQQDLWDCSVVALCYRPSGAYTRKCEYPASYYFDTREEITAAAAKYVYIEGIKIRDIQETLKERSNILQKQKELLESKWSK